ncbi:MAG: ParB/RepB/Spo0J family partition protein [Phycisphaeraceae bacterium]
MATSSRRRLGRGLSEMFAQPVQVDPHAESDAAAAPDAAAASKAPADATPVDGSSDIAPPLSPAPAGAEDPAAASPETHDSAASTDPAGVHWIPIDAIRPNPYQPRQAVRDASIETLAESIRTHGVMQPIVVRRAPDPQEHAETEAFEIIAGERRWRAAQSAGLQHVPALIRDLSDRDAAEWALVENLQREDLNPMDRAAAFARLLDQFSLTHQQVADRVGVDRSSVANLIRLLALAEPVQVLVRDGRLSMGQARAIAGLSDFEAQQRLAERAVRQGLSVRQVEKLVRAFADDDSNPAREEGVRTTTRPSASHLNDLEKQIGQQLGTRVSIRPGRKKGSGKLTIEFYSVDAFDDLLQRLGVEAE